MQVHFLRNISGPTNGGSVKCRRLLRCFPMKGRMVGPFVQKNWPVRIKSRVYKQANQCMLVSRHRL